VELADALVAVDAQDPANDAGLVAMVDMPARQALGGTTADDAHATLLLDQRIDIVGRDPKRAPVVQVTHRPLALWPVAVLRLVLGVLLRIALLPAFRSSDRFAAVVNLAPLHLKAGFAFAAVPILRAGRSVERLERHDFSANSTALHALERTERV
jgi:hypothetical protein